MATHSSILAWRTPWTEELAVGGGVATVHGVTKGQTLLSEEGRQLCKMMLEDPVSLLQNPKY